MGESDGSMVLVTRKGMTIMVTLKGVLWWHKR
jgi:hypothetical protein